MNKMALLSSMTYIPLNISVKKRIVFLRKYDFMNTIEIVVFKTVFDFF